MVRANVLIALADRGLVSIFKRHYYREHVQCPVEEILARWVLILMRARSIECDSLLLHLLVQLFTVTTLSSGGENLPRLWHRTRVCLCAALTSCSHWKDAIHLGIIELQAGRYPGREILSIDEIINAAREIFPWTVCVSDGSSCEGNLFFRKSVFLVLLEAMSTAFLLSMCRLKMKHLEQSFSFNIDTLSTREANCSTTSLFNALDALTMRCWREREA